jgi:tRNA threonylcarbamoyl adenosine modification protein YjeE
VLRALGISGPVPSPTFTLVQHYETAALTVAHFDLYRLTDQEEIHELGFEDACHEGAVMVEWPELLGPLTPVDRLEVHLTDSGTGRTARLVGCGDWASRLAQLQC